MVLVCEVGIFINLRYENAKFAQTSSEEIITLLVALLAHLKFPAGMNNQSLRTLDIPARIIRLVTV